MGGDGGSIPGRQDLVRMKKKKEVLDKNQELAATWRHCALSHNPLRLPVVACEKGRLFNKEALLMHLIDKGENEAVSHVRSLKDVKELNLTPNPAFKDYGKEALIGGDSIDYGNAMFTCPVIGLEMNGRWRFVFFWRCGCVISEKALQELKSDKCHKCGRVFEREDVIVLNGNQPEDAVKMDANMAARRERAKLEKKSKKKRKMGEGETSATAVKEEGDDGVPEVKREKAGAEDGIAAALKEIRHSSDGKEESLMPLSAKGKEKSLKVSEKGKDKSSTPLSDKEKGKDKSSTPLSDKEKGKDKSATPLSDKEKGKESKGGQSKKSVQDDPSKSEIYKSLFTSHKDAVNQPKAHWVTMNPGYFR